MNTDAARRGVGEETAMDSLSEPFVIVIPGTPHGKGRPRFYRGRAVTPKATRAYETRIQHAAALVARGRRYSDTTALRIIVTAAMPIPASWSARKQAQALAAQIRPTGRPDADNLLKIACDGLNGLIFRDDAQIVVATVTKMYSTTPGLRIQIEGIDPC